MEKIVNELLKEELYYEKLENVDDLMDVIEKDKICKLA